MQRGQIALMVSSGLILLAAGAVRAEIVAMEMGGEITYSRYPARTGIQVGDTWRLIYSFDAAQLPTDPNSSLYWGEAVNFTVNGQPLSVAQHPGQLAVRNDPPHFQPAHDVYYVDAWFEPFGGFSDNWPALHIYLEDADGSVFADTSLPVSPVPLSEFEVVRFDIQDMLNGGDMALGTVTYWIPEPATLWLLAAGTLVLVRRRNP